MHRSASSHEAIQPLQLTQPAAAPEEEAAAPRGIREAAIDAIAAILRKSDGDGAGGAGVDLELDVKEFLVDALTPTSCRQRGQHAGRSRPTAAG